MHPTYTQTYIHHIPPHPNLKQKFPLKLQPGLTAPSFCLPNLVSAPYLHHHRYSLF